MQLPPPTSGRVVYDGVDLTALKGEELRGLRTKLQMIFQDPISSLNPRRRIEDIVAEGLRIWKIGDDAEPAGQGRRGARGGRARPRAGPGPPSPPVLRGPVPAHLDRPGRGHRARPHHLRRAGLGPRRVGAGPDPQPARGPQGPLRPDPGVHRPRPGRGQERQRPGRGHVPRPAVRGRHRPTSSTPSPPTPTPPPSWPRSPSPTRTSAAATDARARRRAPLPPRSRRRAATSAPAASGPTRCAPRCAGDGTHRRRALRRLPPPAGRDRR